MAISRERSSATERLRQAIWAGLVALVLSVSTLLQPLDQLTWMMQARTANFAASGDIAFVGSTTDMTDPAYPQRRAELARTLDALREAGVDRVYVDMAFDRASNPEADRQLNEALRAFGGDAYLVRSMSTGINGELVLDQSVPEIAGGAPAVGSMRWRNYMGYSWDQPLEVTWRDEMLPSMAASIAEPTNAPKEFQINYGFDLASIPSYRLTDLQGATGPLGSQRQALAQLRGKVVVIGNAGSDSGATANVPGHMRIPNAMVDIYAAETLKAGYWQVIQPWAMALFLLFLLFIASQLPQRWVRYAGYGLVVASLPLGLWVTAQLALTCGVSGGLVLLLAYAMMRARSKWRRSFRMVDPDTGLPTFAALEADKEVAETLPTIIVARVHRFEEVRKTLPAELHTEYMLRLIGRLKAAKQDAVIYTSSSHMIAWTFPEKEPALIREHLEGLRALFSSPLLVGDHQVDVGITFGVDITPSPNVTRRLAAAVDAAERSTETYDPIQIAELASDEDLIWNISLQARIDAALASGEIYMIYQPKVLVQTGELVGVESLVRWRDPVKGLIPPDHFIRQCENTGRMSHLTRHVLTQACLASNRFADLGMEIPVAVNISSTLVHERDVVTMLREVLDATGANPRRLTLEITETYRISNYERAAEVLRELASLGPKISMDDFGVGAASLEALQKLPFDELKIDRMFVAAMKDDPKARAIVKSVLMMGKDLRIIVVAEGVEDESTLTILRDSGCLVAQGFGISIPVPFDEIVKFHKLKPHERLRNMV